MNVHDVCVYMCVCMCIYLSNNNIIIAGWARRALKFIRNFLKPSEWSTIVQKSWHACQLSSLYMLLQELA